MAVNDMNIAVVAGRLVSDPESRAGGEVCAFTIASNRFYYKDGERKKDTLYIDCSAFGYEAKAVLQLKKGDPITSEGRLELNTWTQNGQNRSKVRMVANRNWSVAFPRKSSAEYAALTGGTEPDLLPVVPTAQGDDIPF